ncbi:DNA replication protein PSF1 PWA37_003739 [Arxiozyma heterogenica]|uniref:DNA replication complex GINS protein PSF1 n=1 Tax=Arxiozyma heterogenica TaxID=278026 RepID=A0AAN8A9R1_9SACH|nr:hypothetical protein RI543_000716 [Kazachstania heterogenica]
MYGDLANKLIIEAKRTEQLTQKYLDAALNSDNGGIRNDFNGNETIIPMYNDELIYNILKEVNQLKQNTEYLQHIKQEEEETKDQLKDVLSGHSNDKIRKCQYFVNLLCLERNKRCLMAYQRMRSDIIDKMVWNGLIGSNNMYNNGSKRSGYNELSHYEQEYMSQYKNLIDEMNSESELWSSIEIMGNMNPPSDIFIDIRVLKDIGEIQTEYGTFNFVKDSQFYVRQSDVERLIQQGYVQKI